MALSHKRSAPSFRGKPMDVSGFMERSPSYLKTKLERVVGEEDTVILGGDLPGL